MDAFVQKIKDYINVYKKGGYSDENIHIALLKSQISPDLIERGFESYKSSVRSNIRNWIFFFLGIGIFLFLLFFLFFIMKESFFINLDCNN